MKVWQLMNVVSKNGQLIERLKSYDSKADLPDVVTLSFLEQSEEKFAVCADGNLRIFLTDRAYKYDVLKQFSAAEAYQHYGGDAICEVIDFGSFPVGVHGAAQQHTVTGSEGAISSLSHIPPTYHRLTHNGNKPAGEFSLSALPAYRRSDFSVAELGDKILECFPWTRFSSGEVNDADCSRWEEIAETEAEKRIGYLSLKLDGQYDYRQIASGEVGTGWISEAIEVDVFNNLHHANDPFITLLVYPRLYVDQVSIDGASYDFVKPAATNRERLATSLRNLAAAGIAIVVEHRSPTYLRTSPLGFPRQSAPE